VQFVPCLIAWQGRSRTFQASAVLVRLGLRPQAWNADAGSHGCCWRMQRRTLTATRNRPARSCLRTCGPQTPIAIGMISPGSSANGMNSSGGILPRVGMFHLSNASKPAEPVPVARLRTAGIRARTPRPSGLAQRQFQEKRRFRALISISLRRNVCARVREIARYNAMSHSHDLIQLRAVTRSNLRCRHSAPPTTDGRQLDRVLRSAIIAPPGSRQPAKCRGVLVLPRWKTSSPPLFGHQIRGAYQGRKRSAPRARRPIWCYDRSVDILEMVQIKPVLVKLAPCVMRRRCLDEFAVLELEWQTSPHRDREEFELPLTCAARSRPCGWKPVPPAGRGALVTGF